MKTIPAMPGGTAVMPVDDPWWEQAACRGHPDPDIFFPLGPAGGALKVCSTCPVRDRCLNDALARGDSGIRGGTTDAQRRLMRAGGRAPIDHATRKTTMSDTGTTEITEALLDGRTVKDVASEFDLSRQQITALINRTDGWSLDAHTDTVVIGSRHDDAEAAPLDLSEHDQENEEDHTEPDDVDLSGLEELLRRGEESEAPAIRAAAKKARAAVDDLRERVHKEAAEKQVRDRIAALEKEMAAAREELRAIRPAAASSSLRGSSVPDGVDSKDVRAWATARGITCPTHGRVPKAVLQQYLTAHGLGGA